MTSEAAAFQLPAIDLPRVFADYAIGGSTFKIYGSKVRTLEEAERRLRDRRTLILSYHFLADDDRTILPLSACRDVVLGEVQHVWYEVHGLEIPDYMIQRQEERMAKAKQAAPEQDGAQPKEKGPRITNRSIIENGLLAGQSNEQILAAVKQQFPDGKADASHITYYRNALVKDGKLEKQPRQTKAKKAEEASTAPATPAKVSARAGGVKPGRESKSTAKARA